MLVPWAFALFVKMLLSERSEFSIFTNGFSKSTEDLLFLRRRNRKAVRQKLLRPGSHFSEIDFCEYLVEMLESCYTSLEHV